MLIASVNAAISSTSVSQCRVLDTRPNRSEVFRISIMRAGRVRSRAAVAPSGRIVRPLGFELDDELDLFADPGDERLHAEVAPLQLAIGGEAVDRIFFRKMHTALVVGHVHGDRLS